MRLYATIFQGLARMGLGVQPRLRTGSDAGRPPLVAGRAGGSCRCADAYVEWKKEKGVKSADIVRPSMYGGRKGDRVISQGKGVLPKYSQFGELLRTQEPRTRQYVPKAYTSSRGGRFLLSSIVNIRRRSSLGGRVGSIFQQCLCIAANL